MRHASRIVVVALLAPVAGCSGGGGGGERGFEVVAVDPPNGTEGFPVTAAFSVTFSRPVDPASAVPGAMVVQAHPGAPVAGTLSVDGATVVLTPDEPLPYDTYYGSLDVSGLRDVDGRAPASGAVGWGARTTFGDFDFSTPLPRFVDVHPLAPALVTAVSTFRSGVGHDYSDDFEACRSMKHYFMFSGADWSAVEVRSPVAGRVVERYDEWAGTKLVIRSAVERAFFLEVFHVVLASDLQPGDAVEAGQLLGHHVGSQTYSDVAVGVQTTADGPQSYVRGRRYVSLFDVLTDARFAEWAARGMADRAAAQLSAAARDAAPLQCSGGTFVGTDTLAQWLALP